MSTDSSQKMFCICKYTYSKHISLLCSLNVSVSSNDTSIFLTLSSVVNMLAEGHNLLVCILGVVSRFTCTYFIHNHSVVTSKKQLQSTFCPVTSLSCFITHRIPFFTVMSETLQILFSVLIISSTFSYGYWLLSMSVVYLNHLIFDSIYVFLIYQGPDNNH